MATKKMQKGGASDPIKAMYKAKGEKMPTTKETLKYVKKNGSGYLPPAGKKMQAGGASKTKVTQFPYVSDKGAFYPDETCYGSGCPKNPNSPKYAKEVAKLTPAQKKKAGVKMKTGGMVNPNAKIQAAKAAGSKGVKSGVNPKAVAAKKATGKSSGGVDTPPKTAIPKAQMGGIKTGKPISEKAAERKASKGKGFISKIIGPNPSDDKGKYIPITRAGRKDAKKIGSVSSKDMKPGRPIKMKGGAMKRGY